jgi:PD-(D/E)XK nuclease superfamily
MKTLEQYAAELHWLKIAKDGVPELYLDNHMMQTFRMCEARFVEDFVNGYGSKGRIWFLDLGTLVHKMIEVYYLNRTHALFSTEYWAIQLGMQLWKAMDMDYYENHPMWQKEFKGLNGCYGLCTLLLQYAAHFKLENERLRVIGTELYFGKGKEVPLLTKTFEDNHGKYEKWIDSLPFRLYLSGKIDLLIDDGVSIGPMDHKTSKDFRGKNPLINYEIQEGMTGYVYAARQLTKAFPELARRPANKIWMNFLQIKDEKNIQDRFKRLPLYKTDEQLEAYRLRMIRTASKIFQLLSTDAVPDYNTSACTNWMHQTCPYHSVHRQGSKESELLILNANFTKIPIWNPETVDKDENSEVDKIIKEYKLI